MKSQLGDARERVRSRTFTGTLHLATIFGFPVQLDLSWFVIAFLVAWSLASGYFPNVQEGLPLSAYWMMGVAGAVGLFVSIVLHELGHAVVARRYDLKIRRIVLFIFGGVAEMESEPPNPKAELLVAIGGPIVSLLLAVGIFAAGALATLPTAVAAVLAYLAFINAAVLAFNLVPAFPLDGGRVLRSALWWWKDDLAWATRVTSGIGSAFGIVLILLGILGFVSGQFIAGIWWAVLGLFLRSAARISYRQVLLRRALEGEPIAKFMCSEPVTVGPDMSLQSLVDEFVYRHHHKMYPVLDEDGRLVGCVTTEDVKGVPRSEWSDRTVADVLRPSDGGNTISKNRDAMDALSKMKQRRVSRLLVVEGARLAGIVSLRDMLEFLSLKIELQEETAR